MKVKMKDEKTRILVTTNAYSSVIRGMQNICRAAVYMSGYSDSFLGSYFLVKEVYDSGPRGKYEQKCCYKIALPKTTSG
jgi:hypothetical protein